MGTVGSGLAWAVAWVVWVGCDSEPRCHVTVAWSLLRLPMGNLLLVWPWVAILTHTDPEGGWGGHSEQLGSVGGCMGGVGRM